MTADLLDAAFRLVSYSVTVVEARVNSPTTNEARLAELRRLFPEIDSHTIHEAYAKALQLEATAIEMADRVRGSRIGNSPPSFDEEMLVAQCPGFSSTSYHWAINDGFSLTR